MNNIDVRHLIGSITVGTDEHNDCLAIAIASYFTDDLTRPHDDPIDEDTGWGKWVIEQTNATLDSIAELVMETDVEAPAACDLLIERMRSALGDIAGSKSLTAMPTQFYQHLQKLAGDATLTYGKTPIEALRDRDRKRDAALLRECISPNNTMLQAHLEELARLRESGKWEPTL